MNLKHFFVWDNNLKAYLILFCLALLMLGANPFNGETIAPMDLLVKYPGWQNTHLQVEHIDGERSDVLDGRLPVWISAKHDLYAGELPVWNHLRGGKPGLTFSNSLLTPAFWAFSLFKNDALGFYFSNLINLLIGLGGMFLFLRIFFNPYASIFGAFIFMFSGFNAAWFFWHHVNTAIWTPWVLFSVYKYLETEEKKYLPLMTLSMFMLNVAGFPMIAVMTYMGTAIMVILLFISKRYAFKKILSTLLYLSFFSVLALLIALPFIYPLVELLSWAGGMKHRHGGPGFSLRDFQLFINPNLYRYPKVETTFYVGILPVIFLGISIVLIWLKPRFIAFFGLILFVYAITIAFTLISPELIHKIPTLNSSLLTRFGYLIGFSLAIIATYVFHEFTEKFSHTKWIYFLIILLIGVQVVDQKKLFHRFNSTVPNTSFYPKTKTISYLQKNIKPFEYIIADDGYLIAGTLGGYGLNDWYAHSFHSEKEKKILRKLVNKPFKTPTSAMFAFSQINLNSPYMDYLGIKAILGTSFSTDQHLPFWDNQRAQQPSPTLPENKLLQKFHLNKTVETNGIALKMATYGEKYASSSVQLVLKRDGKVLEDIVVDKTKIRDNIWVTFHFVKNKTLTEGDYTVSIRMLQSVDVKPLTIWTNRSEHAYPLLVNGKEVPLSLKMVLTQKKQLNKKYKILNLEPNIYLIENQNVKGGAYFLKSLDMHQPIEYAHTHTKVLSNTQVEIQYNAMEKGWVILPMRNYPGWFATVNGKKVSIDPFLGMLPAVKVNGKSTILLDYAPPYSKYTYLLALFGIIVLLFSIIKFRQKD